MFINCYVLADTIVNGGAALSSLESLRRLLVVCRTKQCSPSVDPLCLMCHVFGMLQYLCSSSLQKCSSLLTVLNLQGTYGLGLTFKDLRELIAEVSCLSSLQSLFVGELSGVAQSQAKALMAESGFLGAVLDYWDPDANYGRYAYCHCLQSLAQNLHCCKSRASCTTSKC